MFPRIQGAGSSAYIDIRCFPQHGRRVGDKPVWIKHFCHGPHVLNIVVDSERANPYNLNDSWLYWRHRFKSRGLIMKTLIISGSRNEEGRTALLIKALQKGIDKAGGISECFFLPELDIERCRQCDADGWLSP